MRRDSLGTGGVLGGGVLGTALVFATGCLGTKMLLFLGVSSGALGGLSILEPFRPALLTMGVAALAFVGWRIYRRRTSGPSAADLRTEQLQ